MNSSNDSLNKKLSDSEIALQNLSIGSQKILQKFDEDNKDEAKIPCLDLVPKSSSSLISEMKASLVARMKKQCSKLLEGPWSYPENISINEQTGGLSNYLYVASLKSESQLPQGVPNKVLIRIYGEMLRSNTDSLILDSIVFAILSEKRIGPMLHGVFSGGRIEQFIESRTISRLEYRSKEIYPLIARLLAKFNSFPMPMHKTNTIIRNAEKFISQIESPEKIFKSQTQLKDESIAMMAKFVYGIDLGNVNETEESKLQGLLCKKARELFDRFDLKKEISWIKQKILEVHKNDFSTVFCHNDLQYNNILVAPNKTNANNIDLLLIDFEYCSYNFRGFDIGNILNEWSLDYSSEYSDGFKYIPEAVPSFEEQMDFLSHYMSEVSNPNDAGFITSDSNKYLQYKEDLLSKAPSVVMSKTKDQVKFELKPIDLLTVNPKKIDLLEIQYGMLLSHLFWGVWSFLQGFMSNIEFNYVGYAEQRLELYRKCKQDFLTKFEDECRKLFKEDA